MAVRIYIYNITFLLAHSLAEAIKFNKSALQQKTKNLEKTYDAVKRMLYDLSQFDLRTTHWKAEMRTFHETSYVLWVSSRSVGSHARS